jgi:alkaline phosphatase D
MTNRLRRRLLRTVAGVAATLPFASWSKVLGYPRLMEGPMVGAVEPRSLRIWARASGPYALQLQYSTDPGFTAPLASPPVKVDERSDFAAVLRADGLEPGKRYYYRVLVDGQVDRYRKLPFAATTAPAGPSDFRVAFGSCARYARDPQQRVFDAIARQSPDLFFWLGDNIYGDTESPVALAE